jgi:hypothetical protein
MGTVLPQHNRGPGFNPQHYNERRRRGETKGGEKGRGERKEKKEIYKGNRMSSF